MDIKARNGNGSFRLNVTQNTGAQSRTGTVTVTVRGITRQITVTQAGNPTLTLSHTTWNPGSAANNTSITVMSNTTWNAPTSNATWLTVTNITPANQTGTGSFRLNVTANTGPQARIGTVTVTGAGFTRHITVTQAANSTLLLSHTSWLPGTAAAIAQINVTSNTTWNTPTTNATWMTISHITPTNRTGNGSFRINVTANTGTHARTGTVTVTGGGITRQITVTQAGGAATLTIGISRWFPSTWGGNTTINVTSNTTWSTPTSNAAWLTVTNITPANRTGNGSFRLNVTQNTGSMVRIGIVTVTGGGITRQIIVTQYEETNRYSTYLLQNESWVQRQMT